MGGAKEMWEPSYGDSPNLGHCIWATLIIQTGTMIHLHLNIPCTECAENLHLVYNMLCFTLQSTGYHGLLHLGYLNNSNRYNGTGALEHSMYVYGKFMLSNMPCFILQSMGYHNP